MDWHQKELKAVLAELDVPIDGLRSEEAGKRSRNTAATNW